MNICAITRELKFSNARKLRESLRKETIGTEQVSTIVICYISREYLKLHYCYNHDLPSTKRSLHGFTTFRFLGHYYSVVYF